MLQITSLFFLIVFTSSSDGVYLPSSTTNTFTDMRCSYGERGSLTATCVNATARYFKYTPYKFDSLDVTVICQNCSLDVLDSGTFDLTGNQIKTLDLTRSKITTIQVRAFMGLMYMENLLMAHNYIRSIYPGTFQGIKNVQYLDLENNSISLLADDAFKELVNLKRLNLRANYVRVIQPSAFNGLSSLEEIYLENNQLENLTDVFNTSLPNLSILNLSNNRIKQINQTDFRNLGNITSLDLSNNLLTAIQANTFIYLKNLKFLDLSWNQIDSILPGSFEGLYSLENLYISNALLREIPLKTWQGLLRLENLQLDHNYILEFRTGMYSGLPLLSTLNLSNNQIVKVLKTGLFSLTLHSLDLSHNNITELDVFSLLKHLPKISYLNLEDNRLDCKTKTQLQTINSEHNFKLSLPKSCFKSNESVIIEEVVKEPLASVAVESSGNGFIYVLLAFCFVFIVVLAVGQFYVYKKLTILAAGRFQSEVHLVSSTDLQSRDNADFLRD